MISTKDLKVGDKIQIISLSALHEIPGHLMPCWNSPPMDYLCGQIIRVTEQEIESLKKSNRIIIPRETDKGDSWYLGPHHFNLLESVKETKPTGIVRCKRWDEKQLKVGDVIRIKTQEEAIKESGDLYKWKVETGFNRGSSMDHLFGTEIVLDEHLIQMIKSQSGFTFGLSTGNTSMWSINSRMCVFVRGVEKESLKSSNIKECANWDSLKIGDILRIKTKEEAEQESGGNLKAWRRAVNFVNDGRMDCLFGRYIIVDQDAINSLKSKRDFHYKFEDDQSWFIYSKMCVFVRRGGEQLPTRYPAQIVMGESEDTSLSSYTESLTPLDDLTTEQLYDYWEKTHCVKKESEFKKLIKGIKEVITNKPAPLKLQDSLFAKRKKVKTDL